MYSYRPQPPKFTYSPQLGVSPSFTEKSLLRPVLMLGLSALLVVGLLVINGVKSVVYARHTKDIPTAESLILPAYSKKVAGESSVAKLAKVGDALLAKDMAAFAELNFKRASELDKNYRDMAYGWAYSLLQSRNGKLTDQDFHDLETAIARAEAVDPHYVPLLQLKIRVEEARGNTSEAKLAQQRLDLLQ